MRIWNAVLVSAALALAFSGTVRRAAAQLEEQVIAKRAVAADADRNGDLLLDAADGVRERASAISLQITSTVPEGTTTGTASQVLTFTFGAPVQGFDAADVVLAGGVRCGFTKVSDSVYTLDVTARGGTFSASVASGVAEALTISGKNVAATFSNYYRDIRTVLLPGDVPLELVRIPAGTFTMGSPVGEVSRFDVEIQRAVTISQPFYMGRTEVTQRQWLALMGSWPGAAFNQSPTVANGLGDNYPAYHLCWDDAQAFVSALNAHITNSGQDPLTVRLPTEAEWEYAARAGTTTRFHFGDALGADESCSAEPERTAALWYCGNNSPTGAKPVAQKPANAFLLHDMHGNVFEWVADYYAAYPAGAQTDPTGPATGSDRVVRGGSRGSTIRFCRAAQRFFSSPGVASRFADNGFRLAAAAPSSVPQPVPLTITSTIPAGGVSRSATQTVTFTFRECVEDFTADDIVVDGGQKGAFVRLSGQVFRLDLTGVAGAISVSVPAGVAQSSSGLGNLAAGPFQNFYQDSFTVQLPGGIPMEFLRIPGGVFQMGSPTSEAGRDTHETLHTVTLTNDFYLGRTEVTQEQWVTLQSFPMAQEFPLGTIPVHNLNWFDARDWIVAMDATLASPETFSLPTEAQWERACRAGTSTRFSFGDAASTDDLCSTGGGREDNMWYCGNSATTLRPVAQKLANPWGLHDMHGNSYEWVLDGYQEYSAIASTIDPLGVSPGNAVLRGGAYFTQAKAQRSAWRGFIASANRRPHHGFRIAATRPMPLTIASTIPANTTSSNPTQTLTFEFADAVTGFDAGDISVTGATKGVFTEYAPTFYALTITATANGVISVGVSENAATESTPRWVGTRGGTFSNTYQE